MTRELKFRAWDKWNNEMVSPNNGDFIGWHAPSNWTDRYEVMQFTGLKDKNGEDIYEGNRVKFVAVSDGSGCLNRDSATGEVQYDGSDASFYIFSDDEKYPHVKFWNAEETEIIGNIHQGLELPK